MAPQPVPAEPPPALCARFLLVPGAPDGSPAALTPAPPWLPLPPACGDRPAVLAVRARGLTASPSAAEVPGAAPGACPGGCGAGLLSGSRRVRACGVLEAEALLALLAAMALAAAAATCMYRVGALRPDHCHKFQHPKNSAFVLRTLNRSFCQVTWGRCRAAPECRVVHESVFCNQLVHLSDIMHSTTVSAP